MTYYDDLVNDKKRVNSFFAAIKDKVHGTVYDLGTGSGVLAKHASQYADCVYALEYNPLIVNKTRQGFKEYDNVTFINTDASSYQFEGNIDVVICEMLDTALIDEEQVPVINNISKYATKDTIFIPKAVCNTIELISTNIMGICYYEDNLPGYLPLSDKKKYQYVHLDKYNNPEYEDTITIKVTGKGELNAVKLTTYTILTDDITLEPTPMLNPPLMIPVDKLHVEMGEEISVKLKYVMGGGLNTIKATARRNI